MSEKGQTPRNVEGIEAWITIAAFAAVLTVWLTLTVSREPQRVSTFEQRILAVMPTYDAARGGFEAYRKGLEDYLRDHIALRDFMISLDSRFKVGGLGVSPSSKVIVGKEGWFFLNDEVAVAQYRGLAQLDASQLERWKQVLEERRDWLAERGIPYLVVLVPNKHQVYSEFMPDGIPRGDGDSGNGEPGYEEQHAQLARYLARHSSVRVVDLMPSLLAAKRNQRVYHKTATHWNDIGAYLSYLEILAATAAALPQYADALRPVEVELKRYVDKGIGLTSMIGVSDVYREEVFQLDRIAPQSRFLGDAKKPYKQLEREQRPLAHGVPGAGLPRAVVFRDSFANALIPYMSENFRRVLYVWTRDIEPRFVEREQPDIVIQQIAGRLLARAPEGIRSGTGSESIAPGTALPRAVLDPAGQDSEKTPLTSK